MKTRRHEVSNSILEEEDGSFTNVSVIDASENELTFEDLVIEGLIASGADGTVYKYKGMYCGQVCATKEMHVEIYASIQATIKLEQQCREELDAIRIGERELSHQVRFRKGTDQVVSWVCARQNRKAEPIERHQTYPQRRKGQGWRVQYIYIYIYHVIWQHCVAKRACWLLTCGDR